MNDRDVLDVSERGRVDDRGLLDVSERAGRAECAGRVRAWEASGCALTCLWACQSVGEWTIEACLTCQSVGGFGVCMDMSMGVLGHSELVGARDGYRSMKLFVQNESRTIREAHPIKY